MSFLYMQDIQEFLDEAESGAIYFSLGSNLQSQQLPSSALKALSDAFASVNQRVIWKHNGSLFTQAPNVKFLKWAPQQQILGKIRAKGQFLLTTQ